MSSPPRVSVVMPVYSPDPAYFRQAVESVLGQSMVDLELIIVEAEPAAGAGALAVLPVDERIRHEPHRGPASLVAQLNRGLELARGLLIARMDADDVSQSARLDRQAEFLDAHPEVGVVGSGLRVIDAGGQPLGLRDYPLEHAEIVAALERFNPLAHPSVMFRSEVVRAAGGYQYSRYPAEDYELWCRLAAAGVRFANLPEPLLHYRVHAGSSKALKLRATLRGTIDVKRRYWAGRMTLGGRLRLLAERGLLWLPAPLVYRLFERSTLRPDNR